MRELENLIKGLRNLLEDAGIPENPLKPRRPQFNRFEMLPPEMTILRPGMPKPALQDMLVNLRRRVIEELERWQVSFPSFYEQDIYDYQDNFMKLLKEGKFFDRLKELETVDPSKEDEVGRVLDKMATDVVSATNTDELEAADKVSNYNFILDALGVADNPPGEYPRWLVLLIDGLHETIKRLSIMGTIAFTYDTLQHPIVAEMRRRGIKMNPVIVYADVLTRLHKFVEKLVRVVTLDIPGAFRKTLDKYGPQ